MPKDYSLSSRALVIGCGFGIWILQFFRFFYPGFFYLLCCPLCLTLLLIKLSNRIGKPWRFHFPTRCRTATGPLCRLLISCDLTHAAPGERRLIVLLDVIVFYHSIVLLLDQ